jgi:aspartate/methionine/tyrosine aminotransferase
VASSREWPTDASGRRLPGHDNQGCPQREEIPKEIPIPHQTTIREFQLERYFARWEFEAPYLLSASDCETMSIGELLELAGEGPASLATLRLGYTESQGDPALRETIASRHTVVTADDILVANAPEEAIFLVMMALLQPGDRVVVQTPCYQSLLEVARFRGCTVHSWPMVEGGAGWHVDLDRLRDLVTPDTRLVVINFPHNPTGCLPSEDQFRAILDIAGRYSTRLFCDEMYRGLEYRADGCLSSACDLYPHAISLWGMSKTFGMPGLRIGWLATQERPVIEACVRFKDYTTICSSAPGEFLARVALRNAGQIIRRNVEIIGTNLEHTRSFMERRDDLFEWRAPAAGPVAFPRIKGVAARDFCREAVERAGVLLVPSTLFDFGDQHVRWGLGRRSFPDALSVLDAWLG